MGLPLTPDLILAVVNIQSLKDFLDQLVLYRCNKNILSYAVTYFKLDQPPTGTITFLALNTCHTKDLYLINAPGLQCLW